MPKIRDYSLPQVARTERTLNPIGTQDAISTQYEAERGLINTVTESTQKIEQRVSQDEVSDLNSKFADARDEWTQKIDQSTKDQTINVDKVNSDYQDYINNLNQNISTPLGREFFDKQATRLKSQVIKAAARGQATVKGAKAAQSFQNSLNKNGNALYQDPSMFKDTYDASIEALDAQVASGILPPEHAEKFRATLGEELAQSAVRGWANLSPDLAKKKLEGGEWDSYLKPDSKSSMMAYIHSASAAKETEQKRLITAQENAVKLKSQAWQQKNFSRIADGSLNTKEILNTPDLLPNEKLKMMKFVDAWTKQKYASNPAVKNELLKRALLPDNDPNKIRGITDLADHVEPGGITMQDAQQINSFIKHTPDGEYMRDNRQRLIKTAESMIVKKDMIGSIMGDGTSQENLAKFVLRVQNKEMEYQKEGKSLAPLYDPNSKEYLGNEINAFKLSPNDVLNQRAKGQIDKARAQSFQPTLQSEPPIVGQTKAPDQPEMVEVFRPDGRLGKIPAEKLDAALKAGYKRK